MIRKLTPTDKELILDYGYKHERENVFVIGSFAQYEDTFAQNQYWGYFEGEKCKGIAYYATRWKDLVVHAESPAIIPQFAEAALQAGVEIGCTASFSRFANPLVDYLKTKRFQVTKHSPETVYLLEKAYFVSSATGQESIATKADIDELVELLTGKKPDEITNLDRSRVKPNQEFILRREEEIVSKANIHGSTKNYFQVGGVVTKEAYRRKGYARRVVSFLCQHYFDQGKKYGLLFTGNENQAAQRLYESIGFRPVDTFVIAEFES